MNEKKLTDEEIVKALELCIGEDCHCKDCAFHKVCVADGNDTQLLINALDLINRLAEIEDKIENGTLIELPCKVGDTVYRIRKKPYKAVLERFVVSITLCLNHKGQFEWRLFTTTEDTLGKTVFLTREEAEKRLKELSNDNK